ncbi:Sporulation-specific cell division protein SsgB (plasmid) [Streptomyces sp. enrichment culture]|uniref:SsgA family sporulation/cell division regulator n=1 Tax=Streptomyces sp. enrichment culture TaxID=1795815 RepID=UPI003F575AE9
MDTTVSCELNLRLILSSDSSLPVRASLRYDTADPYAVRAAFHTGAEEGAVEWALARELLTAGLHRPAGIGDVQVWPCRSRGLDVVCIALTSEEGEALLHVPARVLERFLERTAAVVPPGTEHGHVCLDEELSRLLAES